MKQKYYGFDGDKLVYIGDFNSLSEALEYEDNDLFYTASLNEWKEIIPKMMESIKHEYE